MFSVALSVGTPRGVAARVYPGPTSPGYAASRPLVFGLSSLPQCGKAILRPSKTAERIAANWTADKLPVELLHKRTLFVILIFFLILIGSPLRREIRSKITIKI